jgi:hypothetical protein
LVEDDSCLTISADAWLEEVMLGSLNSCVNIGGELTAPVPMEIDLYTDFYQLSEKVGQPILALAGGYPGGDLASLKDHFVLKMEVYTTGTYSVAELPLTDYTIDDQGKLAELE